MNEPKSFTLIAHRGASAEAPENTLSAMKTALEIGVDYIEFDVRLAQDGTPIVIHDETLLRTTRSVAARHVHELTLEQLQSVEVGSWFHEKFQGERVPTLESVLQFVSDQAGLMIEIKEGVQAPSYIAEKILEVFKESGSGNERVKFGSFSVPIIEEMQSQAPHVSCMGIAEHPEEIKAFLDRGMKHMAIWYPLITPELMKMLHKQEVETWTFTVDDLEVAKKLIGLGVKGIITNHPRSMTGTLSYPRAKRGDI